ncbi:MAG: hypothetical protein ACHQ17_06340 [Polyangia bacterium]|jgi:hypothetical protein
MDRHAVALTLALALAAAGGGVALARPRRSHRNHTGGEARAQAPRKKSGEAASLHVRSIDLQRRRVLVEVTGLNKAPPPNFFTFTDERDRHYIAANTFCDPPFASGAQVCELEIPDGYQRHKLVSLLLHLTALHGPSLSADAPEIADAWAAALLTSPTAPVEKAAPVEKPAPVEEAAPAENGAPVEKAAPVEKPAQAVAAPAADDGGAPDGGLDTPPSAPDPRN